MQDQSTVTRNRRVHYLEENPEYFSRGLESASSHLTLYILLGSHILLILA